MIVAENRLLLNTINEICKLFVLYNLNITRNSKITESNGDVVQTPLKNRKLFDPAKLLYHIIGINTSL